MLIFMLRSSGTILHCYDALRMSFKTAAACQQSRSQGGDTVMADTSIDGHIDTAVAGKGNQA